MYVVDVTGWCVRWVGLVGVVGGWQVGVTGGRGSAYEDIHIQSPFIHV